MNNINESAISTGIQEFEKFKELAAKAVDQAKMAEEEAHYYKGQKEQLEAQLRAHDDRHRADLRRIAELEAFISSIIEQYRSAAEKLKLGAYRQPNSVSEGELHEGIRKLAATANDRITSNGDRSVPNQGRS